MLKEIIISIQSYFEAHRFIKKHKLWKWILLPGLFYALFFIYGFSFFWSSSNEAIEWILVESHAKNWLEKMEDSWLSFFFIIGQIFLRLLLLIFYLSLFKFLFFILGSPLIAYLSEKTESIIKNEKFEINKDQFISDIVRGSKIAIRNFFWQTIYFLTFFMLSLIPFVGWPTPIFFLLIDCYYIGFSMLDYNHARKNIDVNRSIFLIGQHRGLAIGNGIVFYLFHALPLVGWVFAPSYAVIAATISLNNKKHPVITS